MLLTGTQGVSKEFAFSSKERDIEGWLVMEGDQLEPQLCEPSWPLSAQTSWAWLLHDFSLHIDALSSMGQEVELESIVRKAETAQVALSGAGASRTFQYRLVEQPDLPSGVALDFLYEFITAN